MRTGNETRSEVMRIMKMSGDDDVESRINMGCESVFVRLLIFFFFGVGRFRSFGPSERSEGSRRKHPESVDRISLNRRY